MYEKIEVIYYNRGRETHRRTYKFEPDDCHCPHCGEKQVWVDTGPGDYYEGESYFCLGCERHFTLPRCEIIPDDPKDDYRQIVDALKKAAREADRL
jgi:hypothetical protein